MEYSFLWIFAVVALQRLFELWISRRNLRKLEPLGGKEFYPETFRNMVAVHVLYFAAMMLESYPWMVPLDARTVVCLVALVLLAALRFWCMAALGEYWNVHIVVVPGGSVKRTGPYRFFRHPNYLAVVLEFIFLPLLMRAPVTLAVLSLINVPVLLQRIRLEEKALRENTDYGKVFPVR